jgi:hypothetical protein
MTPTMVDAADGDKQVVVEAMEGLVDSGFAIWSVSHEGWPLLLLESGEEFELRPTTVRRTR